jgi:alkylated DNA nucleotide flippase Atl1
MKTGEIARAVDMDQANAYLALQALAKQNIAELVPNSEPQRWRLLARYRARQQILAVAGLVRPGEITTYGDISQVVYGHPSGALAVGRIAATSPDFPNPHRVLERGGLIPAEWRTTDGAGDIDECVRLLEADGLAVHSAGGRRFVYPPTVMIQSAELEARLRAEAA